MRSSIPVDKEIDAQRGNDLAQVQAGTEAHIFLPPKLSLSTSQCGMSSVGVVVT